MYSRREDQRERSSKYHPSAKERDAARFKAALKVTKHSPGHKDRPHGKHSGKH